MAKAPDLLLGTPLSLAECEQRLTKLSRSGFYGLKQVTGRAENDPVVRQIGPKQFALVRRPTGEFWLLATWERRKSIPFKWFVAGGNVYHYRIDLRIDGAGTRVEVIRKRLEIWRLDTPSPLRVGFISFGMGMFLFLTSWSRLADNGIQAGWIVTMLLSLLLLVVGVRTAFPRKNERRIEDDLRLFLNETIDADVAGYQAPSAP